MGYKVLYRKYRPTNFNELVGQKSIKEALKNAIIKNQLSHAYIFTGPRGTGKTSMAKIFAKVLTCLSPNDGICCNECINCLSFNENPDIIEIDAASNNGVEEIREIRNNVKLVPTMSKYKIYIVDEVHMLSNSAWNAFLKTLEEPPSHVVFIFATTEINKVPITVLSRCQRFDFHKITKEEIKEHILNISKLENFTISDDALDEIVKLSDGCLRDALSYLDQLSKVSGEIDLQLVSDVFGITLNHNIKKLLNFIYNNDINNFLDLFDKIILDGIDCNVLINDLIDYLLKDSIKFKKKEKSDFDFNFCYRIVNDLLNIQKGIKFIDNPFNALKMCFLNYIEINVENINIQEKAEIVLDKNSKNTKKNKNSWEINENKNISREIISDNALEKLKSIRINNVFVGAQKDLKNTFIKKWNGFIEILSDTNNYTILGNVTGVNVEVVSNDYVLFSTKINSDSVLFNNNVKLIEDDFNKYMNLNYKFIALDEKEWFIEKEKFIKNKNIARIIIDENILCSKVLNDNKTIDEAQDIFGDIIEIN